MKTLEVEVVRVKITLACTECKQRNYNISEFPFSQDGSFSP